MEIYNLVRKNRSYRRFDQSFYVDDNTLKDLINLARLSPSARNMQSLKYILTNEQDTNNKIFSCLAWAAYLKDWEGPEEGERPSAYIVMLNDKDISNNYFCDDGIAAQSILLGAVEKGLGGCIIASVQKDKLRKNIDIPERFEIIQVIALGKPAEVVRLENVNSSEDIKYWRDENQVHHVPKRSLEDLIIRIN